MSRSKTTFVTLSDSDIELDATFPSDIEVIDKTYKPRGAVAETDYFFGELYHDPSIKLESDPTYWIEIKRKALETVLEDHVRFFTKGMKRPRVVNNEIVDYMQPLSLRQRVIVIYRICKLQWQLFWLPKAKNTYADL